MKSNQTLVCQRILEKYCLAVKMSLLSNEQCYAQNLQVQDEDHRYLFKRFVTLSCCHWAYRPLFQKHLSLTHITPHPERGQIHCQIVFLHLERKEKLYRWMNKWNRHWKMILINDGERRGYMWGSELPVHVWCCGLSTTLRSRRRDSHAEETSTIYSFHLHLRQ